MDSIDIENIDDLDTEITNALIMDMDMDINSPESKLLNYFKLLIKFLHKTEYSDVDNLCEQLETMEIKPAGASKITSESTIVGKGTLKKMLLSNKRFIEGLEKSIKALLHLLLKQIITEEKTQYRMIISFAKNVSEILAVFEKHVNSAAIKKSVSEFLLSLIQVLGNPDTPIDLERAAVRLLVSNILEIFKQMDFGRKLILRELSKKLKLFQIYIRKFSKPRELFATPCLENIMNNLCVLKEILMYEVEHSVKVNKVEKNILDKIKNILEDIIEMLPSYIQRLVQECLNSLS